MNITIDVAGLIKLLIAGLAKVLRSINPAHRRLLERKRRLQIVLLQARIQRVNAETRWLSSTMAQSNPHTEEITHRTCIRDDRSEL